MRLLPILADEIDPEFGTVRDLLLGRTKEDMPRAAGLDAVLREVMEGNRVARTTVRLSELFDRLISYRNREIGHGAGGHRGAEFYDRVGSALFDGAGEILGRVDTLVGLNS